ncbi:unnamed protein product [Lepeophtheirus salmonis]|uniref:(salmon louse) hypothetical protein n=1 Tax=Lepeophtheirus salmonis TaxID=72036 RepID=A0A7R8CZC0_LEPSM|nr:unnamed protein product [Lepeophtheirus salmonis]CAF2974338.1 unnamed protein product [Lepeophtheirus salmonis]
MQCSRRILVAIFISIFIISSYVIYDYDSKVRVLLVSNADYRRMTDSLNVRLETLKSELKQSRSSHENVLSERDSTIRRMQEDSERLDHALSEEKKLKESEDAELEKLSRSHQRQINELNQLRSRLDSLSEVSVKLHHCEGQYEALLRMYHSLSDNFQELQDNSIQMEASKISKSSDQAGVLQPANRPGLDSNTSPHISSSSSSSASQKSNLVQPPKIAPIPHDNNGASLGTTCSCSRADDNDLNEDFNDDDTEYESYKKMNMKGPQHNNERDDVVFSHPAKLPPTKTTNSH